MAINSKQEKKSAETRKRILAAADRLFGQYGPRSVSMRDIAQEAHTSTGALYYHFSSKNEIEAELKQDRASILQQIQNQSCASLSPLENLYHFLCALIYREVSESGNTMSEYRKTHHIIKDDVYSKSTISTSYFLNSFIRAAQECGELDPLWAENTISFCILQQVLWMVRYELSTNSIGIETYESRVSELFDLVVRAHSPGTYAKRHSWNQNS